MALGHAFSDAYGVFFKILGLRNCRRGIRKIIDTKKTVFLFCFVFIGFLAHLKPSAVGTRAISPRLRSAAMDRAGDVTKVHVSTISSESWCSLFHCLVLFFSLAQENIVFREGSPRQESRQKQYFELISWR